MESINETLEEIISGVEKAADTKMELWKLKSIMAVSETISSFFSMIIITIILIATILLITVAIAFKIGRYTGDISDGFFIVGGFYLILGIAGFLLQKVLFKIPVQNRLISKMIK